jgi:hypothetical protein
MKMFTRLNVGRSTLCARGAGMSEDEHECG